jgi:hypothetical protein
VKVGDLPPDEDGSKGAAKAAANAAKEKKPVKVFNKGSLVLKEVSASEAPRIINEAKEASLKTLPGSAVSIGVTPGALDKEKVSDADIVRWGGKLGQNKAGDEVYYFGLDETRLLDEKTSKDEVDKMTRITAAAEGEGAEQIAYKDILGQEIRGWADLRARISTVAEANEQFKSWYRWNPVDTSAAPTENQPTPAAPAAADTTAKPPAAAVAPADTAAQGQFYNHLSDSTFLAKDPAKRDSLRTLEGILNNRAYPIADRKKAEKKLYDSGAYEAVTDSTK